MNEVFTLFTRCAGRVCIVTPLCWLKGQPSPHVDQVVGDDSEPHPALHSVASVIAATLEPVASLDYADAPLTSGPPLLAALKPDRQQHGRIATWEIPMQLRGEMSPLVIAVRLSNSSKNP